MNSQPNQHWTVSSWAKTSKTYWVGHVNFMPTLLSHTPFLYVCMPTEVLLINKLILTAISASSLFRRRGNLWERRGMEAANIQTNEHKIWHVYAFGTLTIRTTKDSDWEGTLNKHPDVHTAFQATVCINRMAKPFASHLFIPNSPRVTL